MFLNYVNLGAAPTKEKCVQIGSSPDYLEKMIEEAERYKRMLLDMFGEPPLGVDAFLGIKQFTHDFGPYVEVMCYYDEDDPEAEQYAFNLQANLPERWVKGGIYE